MRHLLSRRTASRINSAPAKGQNLWHISADIVLTSTSRTQNGNWIESVLWAFTGGADGGWPFSGMIIDSQGNLYGTTTGGGLAGGCAAVGFGESGRGTVFKIGPNGRLDRVRSLDRHRRIRWVLPLRSHGDGHARSPVWRCLIRCWLELHQPRLRSQAAAQSAAVPSSSSRHNNRQKSDAGIEGPASFPSQRKKSIAELLCELHEDFVTRS